MVQHIHSRLRLDDEEADNCADGDQGKPEHAAGQDASQIGACRHKAHVCAGEEEHQSDVCIGQADQDFPQRPTGQVQGENLKQSKKCHNGQQRNCNLLQVGRQLHGEHLPKLHGIRNLDALADRGSTLPGGENQPQDQHCQNRANGAQRHQAEAVVRCIAVVTDGGNTHAQCHDKRHRHGAGGHAAGIKGDGTEITGNEECQNEYDQIQRHQQVGQRHAQQHTQNGHRQEQTHTHGHSQNQRAVRNGGHQLSQHLQIRLGNGDDHAQQKAEQHNDPHVF